MTTTSDNRSNRVGLVRGAKEDISAGKAAENNAPTPSREPSGTATAATVHRESVRFAPLTMPPGATETESSGDEHTAIVSRPRGGQRRYNATGNGESAGQKANASKRKRGTDSRGEASLGRQADDNMDDGGDAAKTDQKGESWVGGAFKKLRTRYASVELDNTGSVARDHLALERTFLAWLRTSLSFASIGIAVTQLFRLDKTLSSSPENRSSSILSGIVGTSSPSDPSLDRLRHVGKPLGATFLGVGILVLMLGFHRYFESQHYVMLGKFPASRGSIALITFVAGGLVLSSLVVVLTLAPQALD